MKNGRCSKLGCAVLIMAFSHSSQPARTQSLVDVARLAREARERHGPPSKVYTNADLPPADPTLASRGLDAPSVPDYQSRLDAALERERNLLERLGARSETDVVPAAHEPPKQTPEAEPVSTSAGIPLYLAYGGSPVLAATTRKSRPREGNLEPESTRRHRRQPKGLGPRARTHARSTESLGQDPDVLKSPPSRRPAARSGYEESTRPSFYISAGIPAPGARGGGRQSGPSGRGRPGVRE